MPDCRVAFRIYAPKATTVTLRGGWMDAPAPLLHGGGDDDSGWSTIGRAGTKNLDDILTRHGIAHTLQVSGGGHTWINWRRYLRDYLQVLFK